MNDASWRDAPATVAVAALTILVSVGVWVAGALPATTIRAGLIAARLDGDVALPAGLGWAVPAWATPLSSTLLHANAAHLTLNLVMLVFCGIRVEKALGGVASVALYGIGAYAAAAGQWVLSPHSAVPVIGASGAISATVGAYALLFGRRRARAVGPVPGTAVQVAWLAAAWIAIQALVGIAGNGLPGANGAGVAVGAHTGGFVAGLLLARPLLLWRYRHA